MTWRMILTKIGFEFYFEISRIAEREILIDGAWFVVGSGFGIINLVKISWIRTDLPLFHRTHAMMNMARAKIAPTTVQQQSVIFLYFSLTGSCSGRITFSSNIVGRLISFNKYKFNKNTYKFYLTPTTSCFTRIQSSIHIRWIPLYPHYD